MAQVTAHLSRFLRDARTFHDLSQEKVHDRGGPYRQMQGWLENGDRDDVDATVLRSFDEAYQWPRGYTEALARIGEGELGRQPRQINTALAASDEDALYTRHHDDTTRSLKTLAALYDPTDEWHPLTIGYDPVTEAPLGPEGPTLTNIDFNDLLPIVHGWSRNTIIDTNISTDTAAARLTNNGITALKARSTQAYRTGPEPDNRAQPIAIDALSDLCDMNSARRLAAALMNVYPNVGTTIERAAFTFMVIAAFGGDPLVTITHLKAGLPPPTTPAADGTPTHFEDFWQDFYDPLHDGPELAQPDLAACDLLAGILNARDSLIRFTIGNYYGLPRRRRPSNEPVTTIRGETLLPRHGNPQNPGPGNAIIFYDSRTAPEIPLCLDSLAPGHSLTFYEALALDESDQPGRRRPHHPPPSIDIPAVHHSIGVASSAADLKILAHGSHELGTLTNYDRETGVAIYCPNRRRAELLWIPTT